MADGNDRVQGKIKDASDMKVPYCAVVDPRDAEGRKVNVRAFGTMTPHPAPHYLQLRVVVPVVMENS
jgi:threonyl-tRNA synthetase